MSKNHSKDNKIVFQYEAACPSCGEKNLGLRDTRYRYCYGCGATFDKVNSRVVSENPTPYFNERATSVLKVGNTFKLKELVYYIIGRTDCYDSFREYYSSEGDTGYSAESWRANVWHLESLEGDYIYLVEDNEGYIIGTPLKKNADQYSLNGCFYDNSVIEYANRKYQVTEYGTSRVMFFEGEADDPNLKGTETHFASFKMNENSALVIEEGLDWTEVYLEKKVSEEEFKLAVADNDDISHKLKREKEHKNFGCLLILGCIFMFGFLMFSLFWSGDIHKEFVLDLAQVKIDDEDGWLSPAIPITDIDKAYEITFDGQFASSIANDGYFAVVEILDKDKNTINGFQADFWVESGRDSDGAWRESNPSVVNDFLFEEKGDYYVRIFLERDSLYKISAPNNPYPVVSFKLYEGAYASRYYLYAWLSCCLLWAIFNYTPAIKRAFINS